MCAESKQPGRRLHVFSSSGVFTPYSCPPGGVWSHLPGELWEQRQAQVGHCPGGRRERGAWGHGDRHPWPDVSHRGCGPHGEGPPRCVAGGQFGPRQPPVDTPRREKAEPRGRGTGQRWAVPQSTTATVTHRVPGRARSVIVALPRSARGASLTSVPVTAGAAPAPRSRGLPAAPPPPVQSRLRCQPASGPGESASQGDGRLVSAFGN